MLSLYRLFPVHYVAPASTEEKVDANDEESQENQHQGVE